LTVSSEVLAKFDECLADDEEQSCHQEIDDAHKDLL
jgi:hypothetical protein